MRVRTDGPADRARSLHYPDPTVTPLRHRPAVRLRLRAGAPPTSPRRPACAPGRTLPQADLAERTLPREPPPLLAATPARPPRRTGRPPPRPAPPPPARPGAPRTPRR